MADDKKEPWLNWLALTTVILALCATMATFKGGGYSTKSVLTQTQASDQWAFYQAKSIKGNLYEVQKEKLDAELAALGTSFSSNGVASYTRLMAEATAKTKKYDKEKEEIQKKALELEAARTEYGRHSSAFGVGVIFLQIAIVLSSIAALLKRRMIYYGALIVGIWGVVHFANGFYLFL